MLDEFKFKLFFVYISTLTGFECLSLVFVILICLVCIEVLVFCILLILLIFCFVKIECLDNLPLNNLLNSLPFIEVSTLNVSNPDICKALIFLTVSRFINI